MKYPSSKATIPYPARAIRSSPAMSTAMATPIWSCWEGIRPAASGGVFVLINQGTPVTAIAAEAAAPTAFALGANYPNPFNPATTIPLAVPAGAKNVDLTIYNVLGQPMRQVWTGPLAAGEHRLTWDGRDAQGRPVAAGVYMYRVQVDGQTRTRKMVKLE